MTHRVLKLLPIVLCMLALVVVVVGLTILRAATTPLVRVSGFSMAAREIGRSPLTPAEAQAQKEIEARYLALQKILDKADATELGRMLTPDFTMDRLFGDRVYRYTAQS